MSLGSSKIMWPRAIMGPKDTKCVKMWPKALLVSSGPIKIECPRALEWPGDTKHATWWP